MDDDMRAVKSAEAMADSAAAILDLHDEVERLRAALWEIVEMMPGPGGWGSPEGRMLTTCQLIAGKALRGSIHAKR